MKNWKTYLIIAMVFCMVVVFAGCPGGTGDDETTTTADNNTTTTAENTTTTEEETTTTEEETTTVETLPELDTQKDPYVDDIF